MSSWRNPGYTTDIAQEDAGCFFLLYSRAADRQENTPLLEAIRTADITIEVVVFIL